MSHATASGLPGAPVSAPPPETAAETETAAGEKLTLFAAFKTLHRFEIGPIYFLVLVWGMFVAARQLSDLWSAAAILALFINGLSLFSGFVLNAYSDYPIDRRSQIKGYVADAVERVGLRRTLVLYWTEQALTVAAAAAISVLLHNWLFVAVKLTGIVAGILYNAEPFRMKRRGIWNPVMLAVRFGFVPGMIAYFAVHGSMSAAGSWVLLLGAATLSFSRGFWNSVSDTEEDRSEDILTPAVLHGPRAAMVSTVSALVPACVMICAGLWMLLGPLYALAGVSGAAGATVYRFLLLRRVGDDGAAIALLSGPIRRIDSRWSKATYLTITLVGLAHVLITS
jgi:lycopene elongase/hydratase (dihydrobisanhydrobacterioruberin-forming)